MDATVLAERNVTRIVAHASSARTRKFYHQPYFMTVTVRRTLLAVGSVVITNCSGEGWNMGRWCAEIDAAMEWVELTSVSFVHPGLR